MKYLGKRFSFSMPGNKVDWPMSTRQAQCVHMTHRRYFVGNAWRCRDCKDRYEGKLIVDII